MTEDAGPLLSIIAGRDTDSLIEVRCRSQRSGRIEAREWFPVADPWRAQAFIIAKAPFLDVYVGVAPRTRREGGKSAIRHGWCVWVDIDTPASFARLRSFRPKPSLVVRSGTGSNVHAYWALSEPLQPAWLERANRRLAHALGADMKATDAARILRPPGSLNHKSDPPMPVTTRYLSDGRALPVASIVGGLLDPLSPLPPRRAPRPDVQSDDPLLGISADRYYEVLTGRQASRGNVQCPFHGEGRERNPSMRLYDTTWFCFVCRAGGSVYQFGAHLWNMGTRGEEFKRLRQRLTDALV